MKVHSSCNPPSLATLGAESATTGAPLNEQTASVPATRGAVSVTSGAPKAHGGTSRMTTSMLDAGAVQVEVGPTEGYLSVAFFDRATNNFRTLTPKDLAATNGPVTLVSARQRWVSIRGIQE